MSINGQVVATGTSEAYNSKASVIGGIGAVILLADNAAFVDHTTKAWAEGEAEREAAARPKKTRLAKKTATKKVSAKRF